MPSLVILPHHREKILPRATLITRFNPSAGAYSTTISTMTSLQSLPTDILLPIGCKLCAKDFLALCATCHDYQDSQTMRCSLDCWKGVVRNMFPNNPNAGSADAKRWMALCSRLMQQTQIYGWGLDGQPGLADNHTVAGWPAHQPLPSRAADIQCGRKSTAFLTFEGDVVIKG